MEIVIKLNEENDLDSIDFLSKLTDHEKQQIVDQLKWELKRKAQRIAKREELRRKQMDCQHEFKEYNRSSFDQDGDAYFDDDGEYMTVERVDRKCVKCGYDTSDMSYSNPRW